MSVVKRNHQTDSSTTFPHLLVCSLCSTGTIHTTMAKGRQGFYLEAWKFAVYISIPIIASVYYTDPDRQKEMADYWKFISYPENPNTNVRQKIQELAKEKAEQREQRLAYQRQLQELQRAAERAQNVDGKIVNKMDGANQVDSTRLPSAHSFSLWGRMGRWFRGPSSAKQDPSPPT